ncbi:MAG: phospholipase [Bacteroidales bacterium]|nr:phospholipase [Candidatus Colicola faecequi]
MLTTMVLMEIRERKRQKASGGPADDNPQAEKMVRVPVDDECCGRHSVCERESLLTSKPDIVYYDDEELDRLRNVAPEDYTEEDLAAVQEVFYTMQDKDVAGWLRSLQLREITIPQELLDEALMIVSERRFAQAKE